jgi:soluble lytic murein transglycosylase-like protein
MAAAWTRDAIKTAQAMLNAEFPEVTDDGVWGEKTERAYRNASAPLRKHIDDVLMRDYGVERAAVSVQSRSASRPRKAGPSTSHQEVKRSMDRTSVRQLIQDVSAKEGVPFDTSYRIAWLESKLNPNAVSPTGAKGVFQLTGIAIKDLRERGGYVVTNAFDPLQNVTAGIKYIKLVARDLRVAVTDVARIYMGFNIGPTGAKAVMAGNAAQVAKLINQQAYGSPAVYARNLTKAVNSVVV